MIPDKDFKPDVSVIIVSNGRAHELSLCLRAVKQLYYPSFEIIVVADRAAAGNIAPEQGLTVIPFDEENISNARNAGVNASSGEFLAFIDDDAIPEPSWLDHLIAPFKDEGVAASGGYVMGRNGISLQWGALSMDEYGWTHPVKIEGDDPLVLVSDPAGNAIRTQGTNMALRRSVLMALGGFDPAYSFYMDESDLNLRIRDIGLSTAIVPAARVYHKTAPSARRLSDRTPTTLFDVGASSAVLHRKFVQPSKLARAREELLVSERRRLEQLLIEGRIEPKSFEDLTRTLHDGYTAGFERQSGQPVWLCAQSETFIPFQNRTRSHQTIVSRFSTRNAGRRKARELVANDIVATHIILDPTARFHRQTFVEDGFWEQTGGIFGKSDRGDPILRFDRFSTRADQEVSRISRFRNPSPSL